MSAAPSSRSSTVAHDPTTYRPEVDGLRAIAILSVLLFHLSNDWLPGGFVGVDVFFVISGYLITGLVRRELAAKTWSYSSFFIRRVRRLAPPLLFTTAVTCVVACAVLLPSAMASFAGSVIAQPIAMQNMYFLRQGDYFHAAATTPLLHTWSLGVEEQFYFVWPFLIALLSRLRRGPTLLALGAVLLASFAVNMALPVVSPKASFFLLPARAWELGIGGLLAIVEETRGRGAHGGSRLANCGTATAVAMLFASFCLIDGEMPFPGWVAMVPVGATALLLAALGWGESLIKNILRSRPAVAIGLLSYSLYLWHWPLLAFARVCGIESDGIVPASGLVVISIALSVVSYYVVERPIRTRRILGTTPALLAGASGVGLALIAFGICALQTDGLAFRYPEPARSMLTASFHAADEQRCGFFFRVVHPNAQVCEINGVSSEPSPRPGVLLWGNSHAAMWAEVLGALGAAAHRPVYLNARNCRATTDSAFCNASVQSSILAFIEAHQIEDVLLLSTWFGSYDIPDDELSTQLTTVVGALSSRGTHVWLVVDVPASDAFAPETRYAANPEDPTFGTMPRSDHEIVRQRELALFREIARGSSNVHIIDPTDDFCFDAERCYGSRDGRAYYIDANHVTNAGAEAARARFEPVFSRD
jgi:peptidoglycan/LPS O-acetylase OafA/YrhL